MRRAITGSRRWPRRLKFEVWDACHEADFLILGDCPTGADLWARRFAEFYQRPHRVHCAQWKLYGASAGPIRNREMAADSPDNYAAFVLADQENRGTFDCIEAMRLAGVSGSLTIRQ